MSVGPVMMQPTVAQKFDMLDRNHDGVLSPAELRQGLSGLAYPSVPQQVTYAAPTAYATVPSQQQVIYAEATPAPLTYGSQQVVYEQPQAVTYAAPSSQSVVYEQSPTVTYAAQPTVIEQAPVVTYAAMEQSQPVSFVAAAPAAVYEQPGAMTYTGGVGQPAVYESAQPVSFVAAAQPAYELQPTMTYAASAQPAYELQPSMAYAAAPTMIEAQPQAYVSGYEQFQQAALTTNSLQPVASQRAGYDWQQQQAVMSAPSMVVPAQAGVSFMQPSQLPGSALGIEGTGSEMMAPPPQYDSQPVATATEAAKRSKARKGKKLSSKKTRRDCC